MKLSDTPYLTRDEIRRRVAALGKSISKDFAGEELIVLPVLKGGFHFASDLTRQLTVPVMIDFIRARSYRGTHSQGAVEILVSPTLQLQDKNILIVEDILDTGRTTAVLLDLLEEKHPKKLVVCTLLDKPARRVAPVEGDYVGFEIDDEFVVGYGLDHDEQYRGLPDIHILSGAE